MRYSTAAIEEMLEKYPNARLTITPTPIHRLSRLSAELRCNLYIKREDLTGFALGGNKVRKLDYLIGDALLKESSVLLTSRATSFSRNAAAAGRVFGLETHVVLAGNESEQNASSQSIFKQFGTNLHYVPKPSEESLAARYAEVAAELQHRGKLVYELHPGGSDSIGSLGYLHAFNEVMQYSLDSGVHFNKIVHSSGSTGTQVGLLLGEITGGYDTSIIGIAAGQNADIQGSRVRELALATSQMLGVSLDDSAIAVDDSFIGPGYAIPSKEGKEAARMFADMEGVLLDDVYTGKAAAAVVAYARKGMFREEENILFVHTGGNFGLFY